MLNNSLVLTKQRPGSDNMATWSSRGLRGSGLEELINKSNEKYRENHLGLVQKIPTPITPIKIDKESRHITLAYFEQKSTVDYVGVIQGVPVCFDAKECVTDTFSMQNIHEHQINFMREFEEQGGIAFIILQFTKRNEIYYIPLESLINSMSVLKMAVEKVSPTKKLIKIT